MLRISIRATSDTDVDAEIENLRRAARSAGLETGLIELVVNETDQVVRDFVNRGRQLRALGSQLRAERTLQGNGYDIRVSFETVQRLSILGRVLAAFGR
jgi:hypothetical protein